MISYIITKYKNLPATIIAEQQLEKAKEIFELARQQIQANLNKAELEFEEQREKLRKTIKWLYSVTSKQNEYGTFYIITRKVENPLPGDDEFCKEITYCSFRVINNVVIMDGSGYYFQHVKNGTELSKSTYGLLASGIVPDIFKDK